MVEREIAQCGAWSAAAIGDDWLVLVQSRNLSKPGQFVRWSEQVGRWIRQIAPNQVNCAGDVTGMIVCIALSGEFVVAAEIGELRAAELTNFLQGYANRRIFMPTEGRRLALDRPIKDLPPFKLPLLEEGSHHENVIAAEILQNPRDHRRVLAFGRIVNNGYRGVAKAGQADRCGKCVRGQKGPIGAEGFVGGQIDRTRQMA